MTLDNRIIVLNLDETITPQTVHKIAGEGMPRKADPSQRGDMFVKFDVVFPAALKTECRRAIIGILNEE